MSTTVIASRHGVSLFLLPAAGPSLDQRAVSAVLERHGLDLIEGSDLERAHEFVAAEGLEHAAAAALAEDLRDIGLSARVVNRTQLTGSSRVGNAMAAQMMIGMAGLMTMGLATQVEHNNIGPEWFFLIPMLGGALLLLLAIINGIALNMRGGYGLRVAGAIEAPTPLRALTDQLAALETQLPSHMTGPLLAQANKLMAHARADPNGEAAAELALLMEELRSDVDVQAAEEARELREEVGRARRALAETQKRRT